MSSVTHLGPGLAVWVVGLPGIVTDVCPLPGGHCNITIKVNGSEGVYHSSDLGSIISINKPLDNERNHEHDAAK